MELLPPSALQRMLQLTVVKMKREADDHVGSESEDDLAFDAFRKSLKSLFGNLCLLVRATPPFLCLSFSLFLSCFF